MDTYEKEIVSKNAYPSSHIDIYSAFLGRIDSMGEYGSDGKQNHHFQLQNTSWFFRL